MNRRRSISLALAAALLASIFGGYHMSARATEEPIQLGDYVTMGEYNGEPIKWRCVAFEKVVGTDENRNPIMDSTQTVTEPTAGYLPLMLANTYVCEKEFDVSGLDTSGSHGRGRNRAVNPSLNEGGSNYWGDSTLRCWLNSAEETVTYTCGNPPSGRSLYQYGREPGFLTNFTQEELTRIKPVTQKSILAKCDYDFLATQSGARIGGTAELAAHTAANDTWPKTVAQVAEGYENAYYEYVTDTMFLLDVQQTNNVAANSAVLGSNYHYVKYTASDYKTGYPTQLRTAAGNAGFATSVMGIDPGSGKVYRTYASYLNRIVRPAFYLDEMPAAEPDPTPTTDPTDTPTDTPTAPPTDTPTDTPTALPTDTPTDTPTAPPTDTPTDTPTADPTDTPTDTPTAAPTDTPTDTPTPTPTPVPPSPPPAPAPDNDDDDDDDDYYRPPAKTPAKTTPTPKPTPTPAPTPTPTPAPTQAAAQVEQFSDVPETAWYYAPVKHVLEKGLMVGMNDTEFAPEAEITRAMFVTVLYRMAGEPELPEGALNEPFGDVQGDSWYTKAVYWAKSNGIIAGLSAQEYAPHQGVTREQLAVIVYRYAQWKGQDAPADGTLTYTDQSGISDYARDAVLWSASSGIMQGHGDNTFDPKANTTRGQAAAIFERLMEKIK